MSYKLYTDKIENFEAQVSIQGASLKKSKARLVVESDDFNLLFNGKIKLEVIAEDTYFVPWESEFKVQASKKVTVEVKSQSDRVIKENKVMAKVLSQQKPTLSEKQHVINILKMLIKENINLKNLKIKRNKLNNIIAEYIKDNPIEKKTPIIEKVIKVLDKRK